MATTYQNSFSGSGQVTFQSSSHPVYQVTITGNTTASVTFSADQTTYSATETTNATAHFHVIQDSTGGFHDFDDNESDTRTLNGAVNNVIGLLISTTSATANFSGSFSSDHSSISGNASVTFSGFDGAVGVPITLNQKAQLLPVISFDHGTSSVTEGGVASYTLSRSFVPIGDTGSDVDVQTQDGTALANVNYRPIFVHVHFAAGQTSAVVPVGVQTIDNNTVDNNPDFHVLLINAQNATIGLSEADTTIRDNDQPGPPYPTLPGGTIVLPAGFSGTFNAPDGSTVADLSSQLVTIRAAFGNHSFYTGLQGHGTLIGGAGVDHFFAMSGGNTYTAGSGTTIVDFSFGSSSATIDLLHGTEAGAFIGSDTLNNIHNAIGTNFSDTFIGSGSNDTFDGGAGTDTARYFGNRSAYTVTLSFDGVHVTGPDGADLLNNVELLTFNDATVPTPKPTHWIASDDIGPHSPAWLPSGVGDFNADHTSDLAWYNGTTGDIELWLMSNGHWGSSVDLGPHSTAWRPAGIGDFNHDGTSDIAWYNPTSGDIELWKTANGKWAGSVDLGPHSTAWQPVGVGDFNADGTSDILWYNPTTGDAEVWKTQNGQWAGSADLGPHSTAWRPAGIGDFNHDGTSDVLWYNPTTGDAEIWKTQNGQWAGSVDLGPHSTAWQPAGVADFNGDGTSDVMWFNPATGDIELWRTLNGAWNGSIDVGPHPGGSQPVGIGDFNHDGNNDILWRDPASTHIEAWLLSNS